MIIIGITNRRICTNFYEQIDKIAKSKLNYLVIREKDLDNNELLNLSLKLTKQLENTSIKIIVNSNIEIAKQINADGIQLSFNDFIDINKKAFMENIIEAKELVDNSSAKREKYKIYKMVGVSIHSFDEGIQAYKLGADYVIYGHVFKTDCKKDIAPRGIKEIQELSKKIDIPIIGIGGIDKNNFRKVLSSGAKGIAIMSSLMKAESPKSLIETILNKNQ